LANYPAIILNYMRLGEIRFDPFSQLDLRVDKKWNFKKVSMDMYLDIQNALVSKLPEAPSYGLDRNELGEVIQPEKLVIVNTEQSGRLIPSFGLVLYF
jgi:hypothetical protein